MLKNPTIQREWHQASNAKAKLPLDSSMSKPQTRDSLMQYPLGCTASMQPTNGSDLLGILFESAVWLPPLLWWGYGDGLEEGVQ